MSVWGGEPPTPIGNRVKKITLALQNITHDSQNNIFCLTQYISCPTKYHSYIIQLAKYYSSCLTQLYSCFEIESLMPKTILFLFYSYNICASNPFLPHNITFASRHYLFCPRKEAQYH